MSVPRLDQLSDRRRPRRATTATTFFRQRTDGTPAGFRAPRGRDLMTGLRHEIASSVLIGHLQMTIP
jgi:hypothetical protein